MTGKRTGRQITIRGIVQGVGFRPKVFSYAQSNHLTGWVRNISSGVEIRISGAPSDIDAFVQALRDTPPPLARIDEFCSEECPAENFIDFQIISSQSEEGEFIPVSPDIALCDDCKRELFDPKDRRYLYPFINCTNCGPRFTIIRDIPYDRPKTTMAGFTMCPACRKEYEDPANRRFHAQPIACPVCGPQLSFEIKDKVVAIKDAALNLARQFLKNGKIVAVKGLGGYLLACDAYNVQAVEELRNRKHRTNKPFALMAADLKTVENHCHVSASERSLLISVQHPIVLLEKKVDCRIPEEIAPGQRTLGFMLPYTPHQELLMLKDEGFPDVLVMTSGNLSEEPIAYEDDDAHLRLDVLADGFFLHDRPIHIRVDDSVVRINRNQSYLVRRSRGYAPNPVLLPVEMGSVLATGTELKNTFCMTRDRYAFLSHHIGDMQNQETLNAFESGIEHFRKLFRIEPEIIACDLHPDYLASNYGRELSCKQNLPLVEVQHHHAHLASCLADNGWDSKEPVIGVIFDGTGYGSDGNIWGGEILIGGYASVERRFHLEYFPLPGGDAAIHHPTRSAIGLLWQNGLEWRTDLPITSFTSDQERSVLQAQLERSLNTPLTSSVGRLFDAASAILGICHEASFEGEPAILLEAVASDTEKGCYDWGMLETSIPTRPLLTAMLKDIQNKVPTPIIASRFHNSIIQLVKDVCTTIEKQTGIRTIVLSGGVWQNMYLLSRILPLLETSGFRVLIHHQVPTNDGGVSLGQAVVAGQKKKE
jgi:hydrogenase maturation protein HypF